MLEDFYGSADLLPLWVADMDFQSPGKVISDLKKKAEFGIYGYTSLMPSYYEAIINWFNRRHNFTIQKEWIVYCPGVVPAINMLIQALTNENDKKRTLTEGAPWGHVLLIEDYGLSKGKASILNGIMVGVCVPGNLLGGWLLPKGFRRWHLTGLP